MKKKRLSVMLLCTGLCLGAVGTIAAVIASQQLIVPIEGAETTDTFVEKAYEHPTTSSSGLKPYYMDSTTCGKNGPSSSRYDYADFNKSPKVYTQTGIEALTIPSLTSAEAPTGDLISAINPAKYKYVDQGVNGVDGEAGTSVPFYVSDAGHTALFMSRSGKTGDPLVTKDNANCSEFRFTSDKAVVSSITFSYRYLDYGTGYWNNIDGAPTATDPGQINNAHFMVQMKDSGSYFGQGVTLVNDDAWHTMTVAYASSDYHWVDGAASNESAVFTTNLTDIIFKFVDLRGHIFVSGLSTSASTVLSSIQDGTAFDQDVTNTEGVITYSGDSLSLPSAWVSQAIVEGYTHLRLHVNAASTTSDAVTDILLSDSVSSATYNKTNVPDNDIRVTLTTVNSDKGGIKIEGRKGATADAKVAVKSAFTASDFHLYKSSETLAWAQPTGTDQLLADWTKYTASSHLYVAYEDGELVIDNIGGKAYEKVVVMPENLIYNHYGLDAGTRFYYKFLGSQDGNCYDGTSLRTSDKTCYFQSVGGSTTMQGGSDKDNDAYGYSYMTRKVENSNGIVLGLQTPTAMKFKPFDVVSFTLTAPATSAWGQMPNTYAEDGTTIYHVNITNTTWQYFNFGAPKGAKKVIISMTSDKIIENADPAARLAAFDDTAQVKMNAITRTGEAGAYSYAATTIDIEGKAGWTARYGADGDHNTADMPAGTAITVTFDYYYTY